MIRKQVNQLSLEDIQLYFSSWQLESAAGNVIKDRVAKSLGKVHKLLQFFPSSSGDVLQIGASPFFLSSLLHRYGEYQLTLAENIPRADDSPQRESLTRVNDGFEQGPIDLSYAVFDIEQSRFPYQDGSFDAVILNDFLHHIVRDPVFVFSEIHRILKPDGWLLLNTPNAAYYRNLAQLWLAQNIFPPYSTQNDADRHSRYFTIPELSNLFRDMHGLAVERLVGLDTGDNQPESWRMKLARTAVRTVKRNDLHEEYIYCLARRRGDFNPSWPMWLYRTYKPERPQISVSLDRSLLRLPETLPGPSRFARRVCKLCDLSDWYGEDWLGYLEEMDSRFPPGHYQRKAWEWAQGVYALDHLGLLREDVSALGVGCGTEAVLFYLANKVGKVTATDIYGEGSFAGVTAYHEMMTAPEKFARFPYRRDHLEVTHMDGTNLTFPDESFDIAFSFSSIEHFGGHAAATKAVQEMGRVLKPGGAVVLTTEVILNGASHDEFFKPRELLDYLVKDSGLSLMEDIDFSISDETLAVTVDFSHPGLLHVNPQVVCRLGGIYWTSVCIILIKET